MSKRDTDTEKQPKYAANFACGTWSLINPLTGNNKQKLYEEAKKIGFRNGGDGHEITVYVWRIDDAESYHEREYVIIKSFKYNY